MEWNFREEEKSDHNCAKTRKQKELWLKNRRAWRKLEIFFKLILINHYLRLLHKFILILSMLVLIKNGFCDIFASTLVLHHLHGHLLWCLRQSPYHSLKSYHIYEILSNLIGNLSEQFCCQDWRIPTEISIWYELNDISWAFLSFWRK